MRSPSKSRFRYLLVFTGVLALTVTGVASGVTGDPIREGQRNPASGFATQETRLFSDNANGFTARLSNFNVGDGGSLASGCRAAQGNEACLVAANLNTGRAFDFASGGAEAGRITLTDPAGKPFTTNATGVATGLNADKVDGLDGADLGNSKVESIHYAANIGSPLAVVLVSNGVAVEVDCTGVQLARARSTAENSAIQIVRADIPDATGPEGVAVAAGDHVVNRDSDFDVNQTQNLSEAGTPATGTMVFGGIGGGTVTMDYAVDYFTPQGDCVFFATAAGTR